MSSQVRTQNAERRKRNAESLWFIAVSVPMLMVGCVTPVYVTQPATPVRTQSSQPVQPGREVIVSGGEGTEVLAEGVAALPSTGAVDMARDQALRDALRKAVEQGVGTFVSSESRVQNFQLISDRIISQANGYVSSYSVVTEGQEGSLYRVVIRAKVKLDRIEDDLAAIGILLTEQGRPRVMVLVKEVSSPTSFTITDQMMSQELVETMLIDAFQSKGFPVVEAATVQKNLGKEQLKRILEGDNAAATLLGLKTGAEIVVAGTYQRSSEQKQVPYSGTAADFYKVRLSARAVNAASSEVLGSCALTKEVPFSEDEARRQAADSAGSALISKILAGWKKRSNVTLIAAHNATFERAQKLKSEIQSKLRGVLSVVSRDLVGSTATLEIVSETSSQEVLDGLTTRGISIPFEVKGLEGNRIEIRFKD